MKYRKKVTEGTTKKLKFGSFIFCDTENYLNALES